MASVRLGLLTASSPMEHGAGEAAALQARLVAALGGLGGLEVFPLGEPVSSPAAAVAAGRYFYDQRLDAICVLAASWFEDYLLLDLLEECDLPLILWARPGMETGSLCGTQQLAFMLRPLGKPYCALYAEPESTQALARAGQFAQAAGLRRVLRRARLGMLGHRVNGMTETTAHELALKKVLGPRIIGLDTAVYLQEVESVSEESVRQRWQEVKRQVGAVRVGDAPGILALRHYLALKRLFAESELSALAFGCYPHLYGQACLALSLLNEEGLPVSCEGDINAALGMLMMSYLAGEPTNFGEYLDPIPERNSVIFSHCGATAFSLARSQAEITLAPVRLTDSGMCCLFTGRPGPCTLVGLASTMVGYRINILYGEALPTEMHYRGNPVEVQFRRDYREIADWITDNGIAHHWVIAYGDLRRQVRDLAAMTGCELIGLH